MRILKSILFLCLFSVLSCNKLTVEETPNLNSPRPTNLELVAPLLSPSTITTPTIRVSGVEAGQLVKLYSNSTCTNQVGSGTATGTTIDIVTTNLNNGIHQLHAISGSSRCSTASLNYEVDLTPTFNLLREHFSYSEGATGGSSGVTVGVPVTITRSATGVAQSIDLVATAITADSSVTTIGIIPVAFGINDLSVTLDADDLGISANTSTSGDKNFRINISDPNNGGILGTRTEAVVNVLDAQLPDQFFFPQSLYTATENGGNLTVRIQRAGDTSLLQTVQVSTINSSASVVTDFGAGTFTATFSPGSAEAFVTIPIVNTFSPKDSKSFFLKLINPSNGTTLRAASFAKVRILDEDDTTTVCDPAAAGFGGGSGSDVDPYRICSLAHFNEVRNNMGASFRLMADLDLNPLLDSDPGTVGGQRLTPFSGTFSGTFNGDEHTLRNFEWIQTTNPGNAVGLFHVVGTDPDVFIKGINLIQSSITSSAGGVRIAGLIGETSGTIDSIEHNHFSGLVSSANDTAASGLIARANGNITRGVSHNFTSGFISAGSAGGAGILNISESNMTMVLDYNLTTASVISEFWAGGILGAFDNKTSIDTTITECQASGFMKAGTGGNHWGGGITAAVISDSVNNTIRIFDNKSYVVFDRGGQVGGLIGEIFMTGGGTFEIRDLYFSGRVANVASGAGAFQKVISGNDITFSGITVERSSISSNGSAGGISVEARDWWVSGKTLIFDDIHVSETTVNANGGYVSGGIFGMFNMGRQLNNSGTLQNCSFSGTVLNGVNTAGLVAQLNTNDGNHQLTLQDCTVDATIDGNGAGGAVGWLHSNATDATTILVDNISVTGSLDTNGAWTGGGLISKVELAGTSNSIMTVSNSETDIVVTGLGNMGGAVGQVILGSTTSTNQLVFTNLHSQGPVTGEHYVGGLIGSASCSNTGANSITVNLSSTTSNVSGIGNVGGFFGYMSNDGSSCVVEVSDTYSTGSVQSTGSAGSYAGTFKSTSTGVAELINSYSLSAVTASGGTGGLAWDNFQGVFTNSYWLKEVGGVNDSIPDDVASMRTTAELQSQVNYVGWALGTTWTMPSPGHFPTFN